MTDSVVRPDVDAVLHTLKDFQRDTVEYVYRRMYRDEDATRRFLIADEVGLGKTLVARGVVVKAIDHLWDMVDRIDIVYICSNADIARQNINRLNVTGSAEFALASRITLLPTIIEDLKGKKLNFVSFTPGTSFDLRSSLGTAEERVLLHSLLSAAWDLRGASPLNVLQGNASMENFRAGVREFDHKSVDPGIRVSFEEALRLRCERDLGANKQDIRTRFLELCERFARTRSDIPPEDARDRNRMVGELRALLAETCLEALEPDLIIMDEFQRFKYLLDGDDEASKLAQGLFDYSDEHSKSRVLLLSATPYKMYTMSYESEQEDHYKDFLRTVRFLQNNDNDSGQFEATLTDYRHALFHVPEDGAVGVIDSKMRLEKELRRWMVRTEKLAVTEDRNGMLVEIAPSKLDLKSQDIHSYLALEEITKVLDQGDTLEYWKSAPYLLNFMDDYKLKESFEECTRDPQTRGAVRKLLIGSKALLLPWEDIRKYAAVDPANARLRQLVIDTVDRGAWKILWVPPCLPYYQLQGPFANPDLQGFTKRLVFSSWKVVPKVIATMLSYEADRRMVTSFETDAVNTAEARKKRRPLLRFARTDGRLTGMPLFALIYPSVVLSESCDPLEVFLSSIQNGDLPSVGDVLSEFQNRCEVHLSTLNIKTDASKPTDERWYWLTPILLDAQTRKESTEKWFADRDRAGIWAGIGDQGEEEDSQETRWSDHVNEAIRLVQEFWKGELALGPPPSDLTVVLAQIALGSGANAALRGFGRATGEGSVMLAETARDGAAQIGYAFLTLFNFPEVSALLRGMNSEEPYWRRVLEYSIAGGIQSVLDEYFHVLKESLGLTGKSALEVVDGIADAVGNCLRLRRATLGVDDIVANPSLRSIQIESGEMPTRFAQRFGQEKERSGSGEEASRSDQVRASFNSPFWPFVLASTSVGQEGLDFHNYCHAVVHWNLPSNPVDLEQREGRVHRYKGHAVRRNVARRFGCELKSKADLSPWDELFDLAKSSVRVGLSDLTPYWIFAIEEGARIERHVPALPLSRDIERLEALRRSLAVYRLVFGQTRQTDLVEYLIANIPKEKIPEVAGQLQVDLSPPQSPIR